MRIGIDPRLIEHFELFRKPGPGPHGPLEDDEADVIGIRREASQAPTRFGRRLSAMDLAFDEVRKVILSSGRVLLVIPGSAGIHLLVRTAARSTTGGSTATVEAALEGRAGLWLGQTLVALAPDGVDGRQVEFLDGSSGYASVRHNAYAIDDPGRAR
jgi:hypothetical protein